MCAGINFVAGFFIGRQGFAGDGGLIERTLAIHNDAVGSDIVAGANADDIANREMTGRHFFFAAIFQNSPRFSRREFDERFNRIPRAFGGARFDDFTGQHEEGNNARRFVIAGSERREHGNGDQFVDAQIAAPQILDRRNDDGKTQNQRTNHSTAACDRVGGIEQPVHNEGVENEYYTQHRLPEMHHGMFVVMTAAAFRPVLVLAQKGGDLHKIILRLRIRCGFLLGRLAV